MRILQIIHSRRFAGSEQSVLTLSKGLLERGHEVWVAVKSGGILAERYDREGLQVAPVFLDRWPLLPSLEYWVKEAGIELVHTHLTQAGRIGLKLHRRCGLPLVAHLRILRDARVFRKIAAAGYLIANSSHTAGFYVSECGYPADRVVTVPNSTRIGQDASLNIPREALRRDVLSEFGLKSDSFVVILTGRVSPGKGHDLLLEAWGSILRELPEARLLIVGDTRQKPVFVRGLMKQVKATGEALERSVVFAGYRQDVPRLLRSADVQVVPSKREPFGLVVIEAMMVGTPVIGSASGAIPGILEEGRFGELFAAGDPEALAQAVLRVAANPYAAQKRAELAKLRAEQIYTPTKMLDAVEEVYRMSCKL